MEEVVVTRERPPKGVQVTIGISADDDVQPLRLLSGMAEGLKNYETQIHTIVQGARKAGHTWEEIGEALGVSRQAAWERYSVD